MNVLLINGPNLNLLGLREPQLYGSDTLDTLVTRLQDTAAELGITLHHFQNNHEGAIVDAIHQARTTHDYIIINAGAYTHTSIALHDAIRAITAPVIEVHISNVYTREPFRHHSCLAAACRGVIAGFGLDSYRLAIEALK